MTRLNELDSLRGIGALCVVFQHAMERTNLVTGIYSPILQYFNLGRFGVMLFFMISGFVIPPSIERAGLGHFALGRMFRLVPALWVSVALCLPLFLSRSGEFTPGLLAANMTMTSLLFGVPAISGVYWSLTYELGFYVFCAMLFAGGQIRSFRLIGTIAMLLSIGGGMFHGIINGEWLLFPAYFLFGMIVRLHYDGDKSALPWLIACAVLLALCALPSSVFVGSNPFFKFPAKLTGMLAPMPVFLWVVYKSPRVPGWSVWLGSISYSTYLLQDVALTMLAPFNSAIYPPLVAAMTVAIAAIVYHGIEKPCISAGRTIAKRWRPAPA